VSVDEVAPGLARARRRSLGPHLTRRGGLPGLVIDLVFVGWLIWGFDAINNLASVRQRLAESNGRDVLSFESSLHLAPEHALNAWLASRATLSQIVVFWYENVHILVTLVVIVMVWWRRPEILRSSQATLVIVNVIALAIFWAFPVAPARMLPGYVDLVAVTDHLPAWRLGATALHSNQLCSLPSLHIAWATWSSIMVWRMTGRRAVRAAALVYPFVTSFAVMATANHYLADALSGAAITLVVYSAQRAIRSPSRGRLRGQPAVEQGL
jgi:hypothetical protein